MSDLTLGKVYDYALDELKENLEGGVSIAASIHMAASDATPTMTHELLQVVSREHGLLFEPAPPGQTTAFETIQMAIENQLAKRLWEWWEANHEEPADAS